VPSVYLADVILAASFKDVTPPVRRVVLATTLTAVKLSAALTAALNVSAQQLVIAPNSSVSGLFHVDISGFGADSAESIRVAGALATLDLSLELGAGVEVTEREAYVVFGAQSGVSNSPSEMDDVAHALELFLEESVVLVFSGGSGPLPRLRPSPPTVYTPVTQPPPPPSLASRQTKDRKMRVILIVCTTVGGGVALAVAVTTTTLCILKKKGLLGRTVLPSRLRSRAAARVVRKVKL
jgi:hypothetical protein